MLTNDELDGFGLTQMVASLLHHILGSMSGMIQMEKTGQSNLQPTGWSNIENKKAPPTGRAFELAQEKEVNDFGCPLTGLFHQARCTLKVGCCTIHIHQTILCVSLLQFHSSALQPNQQSTRNHTGKSNL